MKEIIAPACGVGDAPDACGGCSSSWCAESTPCGGIGQRACCSIPSCNDGLIEDFTEEGSCANVLEAENCACAGGGFLSLGTCRDKKGVGESCDILTPCEEGLICRAVSLSESKCFADLDGAVSAEECLAFFDRNVLDLAVNATPIVGEQGESLFFGYGGTAGFIGQASEVRGVVYGRDGCYGCYQTSCDGFELSAGFSGLIEQAHDVW